MSDRNYSWLCDRRWQAALLFTFSLLIYSLSLFNGFVTDSVGVILYEPRVRQLSTGLSFFSENFVPAGPDPGMPYYRPLTGMLHTVEYALFGPHPFGYKLVNLLLNSAVVVLVWAVLSKMTRRDWLPLIAAALYAAVPARAEVVYWVYSDSHLLVALFSLLALLALQNGRTGWLLAAYAAALLSQEAAVVFPLLAALYLQLHDRPRLWSHVGLLVLVTASYLGIRAAVVGGIPLAGDLSLLERLIGVGTVAWKAVRVLLWPEGLMTAYQYTRGMFQGMTAAAVAGLCLLLISLLLGGYWWRTKDPRLLWIAWWWAWLLPGLNVGGIGDYWFAEKSISIAALGPCVLVAESLLQLKQRRIVLFFICGILLLWGGFVVYRAQVWKNSEVNLKESLKFDKNFTLLYVLLGSDYELKGDYVKAIEAYSIAYGLNENSSLAIRRLSEGYARKAYEEMQRGDTLSAEESLRMALKYNPDHNDAGNNLGVLLKNKGSFSEAETLFTRILQKDIRQKSTVANLSRLYLKQQRWQESKELLERYRNATGDNSEVIRGLLMASEAPRN